MRELEIGGTLLAIAEAEDWESEAGACVWDAALVLAYYLQAHAGSLVSGKRVIELGAGPGAVGCAAAALGAAAVTLTDLPHVLPLAASNVEANGLSSVATTCALDWADASLPASLALPADLVLASDVLYQAEALPLFVSTLQRICAANPAALLVLCHERRPALPFPEALFSRAGFAVERVPLSQQHLDWSSEDIELFHIRLAVAASPAS